MSGDSERDARRGPRGATGATGERGEAGMDRKTRRAIVYLFVLAMLLAATSILFTVAYVGYENHQQQAAQRREQAAQRRAGETAERKLCTTLSRLAALKPPPGSPADNPSRAYLQGQHATLAELGPDLGCR